LRNPLARVFMLSLLWVLAMSVAVGETPGPRRGDTMRQALARAAAGTLLPGAALTCTPAPCLLPNVQISVGVGPVDNNVIAVNPKNTKQLLSAGDDFTCDSLVGGYTSNDSGATWSPFCMTLFAGAEGLGQPTVAYDRLNRAYLAGLQIRNQHSVVVLQRSPNNGTSWSGPRQVVGAVLGGDADSPFFAIDTTATSPFVNSIYLSSTQFDAAGNVRIFVTNSHDGGATYKTVAVSSKQLTPKTAQFSTLAVGRDGTVYAAWLQCPGAGTGGACAGGFGTMMFAKSGDGGAIWSAPKAMTTIKLAPDTCGCTFYGMLPNTTAPVSNFPAIAVDNSTAANSSRLYVSLYSWTGTQMRVGFVTSGDGGTSWSAFKRISSVTSVRDQFFPWISVNLSGLVGVSWMDRRNDTANLTYEAFAAFSSDGGVTFSAPVNLSTVASDPVLDGFSGSFLGDQTGNAWAARTFLVVYPDTRSGVAQAEAGGAAR
jgi:hypothetical protein